MRFKGDSERQAFLRDQAIKRRKTRQGEYISKILSVLKPRMRLLDIGCGTGHIIQQLATRANSSVFTGLDISPAMVKTANANNKNLHNTGIVEGDGHELPFPNGVFDVVITRLADYSPQEAYRVLRKRGCFLECSLGPEADKEIKEFFQERIDRINSFFPRDLRRWKQEVCEDIREAGFSISNVEDYKEPDYYEDEDDLMDLIEMVPLVKDFSREKDRETVKKLAEKYGYKNGVRITWHYYIILAEKP